MIESARTTAGEDAWIGRAMEALREAKGLPGCSNRVNYLTATAHLARADLIEKVGGDPSGDLRAALAFAEDPSASVADD